MSVSTGSRGAGLRRCQEVRIMYRILTVLQLRTTLEISISCREHSTQIRSVHFDMTLISCWGILTDKIQVRRRVFQWRLFPVSFLFLVFSYPVMSSSCSDTIYHAYHIIGKESCMLAWHSIEGDKIVSIFKMNYWCRGRFCDFHEKTDGRALLLRSVSHRKVNIKNNGFNRIIMYCPDPLRYFRSSLILLKQVRELC